VVALGFHAVVKLALSLLVLVLVLAVTADAYGAGWRSGGRIAASNYDYVVLGGTAGRDGDALFSWWAGPRLSARARSSSVGFGPPQLLTSKLGEYTHPSPVVGNAHGDAVQAWAEADDPFDEASRELVALRSTEASRDFQASQSLYDGGQSERICDQAAAISDSGQAVVVFTVATRAAAPGGDPAACRVYAAVRRRGSLEFGAPVQLSGSVADSPEVAIDARGNALVAWHDLATGAVDVVRARANEDFRPPQSLSVAGAPVPPSRFGRLLLRVSGATGRALVAFPTQVERGGTATSGFGRAALVSGPARLENEYERHFDAAAAADGTLAVAWRGGREQGKHHIHVALIGRHATSIAKRHAITLPGGRAGELALSIEDGGRVTIMWTLSTSHGVRRAIMVATDTVSRGLSRPQRLSANGGPASLPQIATSSRGDRFATWLDGFSEKTLHWAKAAGSQRFGRSRLLARRGHAVRAQLYPGARGAMLAAVEREHGDTDYWQLFSYGERQR
jgi:hypothetical protein